jgi:hypothetical protein
MKLAFVLCVLVMTLHGCKDESRPKPVQLSDGRWAMNVGNKAKVCEMDAMVHGADTKAIERYFNACVFNAGITI